VRLCSASKTSRKISSLFNSVQNLSTVCVISSLNVTESSPGRPSGLKSSSWGFQLHYKCCNSASSGSVLFF
jgi:hypothetical protein